MARNTSSYGTCELPREVAYQLRLAAVEIVALRPVVGGESLGGLGAPLVFLRRDADREALELLLGGVPRRRRRRRRGGAHHDDRGDRSGDDEAGDLGVQVHGEGSLRRLRDVRDGESGGLGFGLGFRAPDEVPEHGERLVDDLFLVAIGHLLAHRDEHRERLPS